MLLPYGVRNKSFQPISEPCANIGCQEYVVCELDVPFKTYINLYIYAKLHINFVITSILFTIMTIKILSKVYLIKHDEPSAMRDSLMAHGVPEDRIILDYAGFRTLDSVVRAKEVFGCDSFTIISQHDHNARALYLAEANGIYALAITARLNADRWVRARLAMREWLARDKMLIDIWVGKRPHFLGEKIMIPDNETLPTSNFR